jgi:hypothetical protein
MTRVKDDGLVAELQAEVLAQATRAALAEAACQQYKARWRAAAARLRIFENRYRDRRQRFDARNFALDFFIRIHRLQRAGWKGIRRQFVAAHPEYAHVATHTLRAGYRTWLARRKKKKPAAGQARRDRAAA